MLYEVITVSNIRYYAFKDPELFRRQPFGFLVLAIIFIIVIVAAPEIMIFAMACTFVSSGPIGFLLKRFVITSYSIHYTKLYEACSVAPSGLPT